MIVPFLRIRCLRAIFFTSFEKNGEFFLALNESPLTQEHQFHRAGRQPLTEIFMFRKTLRNPSNRNQHLHGNSKSETEKTPSHLITKTPWTHESWDRGDFFLVQTPKDSTSSTTSSDIACKMQPVGSGSLCTDRAV